MGRKLILGTILGIIVIACFLIVLWPYLTIGDQLYQLIVSKYFPFITLIAAGVPVILIVYFLLEEKYASRKENYPEQFDREQIRTSETRAHSLDEKANVKELRKGIKRWKKIYSSEHTRHVDLLKRYTKVEHHLEALKEKNKELRVELKELTKEKDRFENFEQEMKDAKSKAEDTKNEAAASAIEIRLLKKKIQSESNVSSQSSEVLQQILSTLAKHVNYREGKANATYLVGSASVAKEIVPTIERWLSKTKLPPLGEQFEYGKKAIARCTDKIAREINECNPHIPELFRGLALELMDQALVMRSEGKLETARTYAIAAGKLAERVEKMYQDKLIHGLLEALKR